MAKNWTKEELTLALNLYSKIPFGKQHHSNPEIIALSKLLGRTSGSVAMKLNNFSSLDPELKARGIRGLPGASSLDRKMWQEYYAAPEEFVLEGESLLTKKQKTSFEKRFLEREEIKILKGAEKQRLVRIRVNQYVFRKTILSAYNYSCCITGIQQPELLIAGHIMPWSASEENRLNFRNGLCLNALHDKAFEAGLIAVTPEYVIRISSRLKKTKDRSYSAFFIHYEGKKIEMPERFLPDKDLLNDHFKKRFIS